MAFAPGSADHRRHYAAFASLAYQDGEIPVGYRMDADLSNRNRKVYVNDTEKKAILAFRGTQPNSKHAAADLGTDLALALNMRDTQSRFKNALKSAKKTRERYMDYELTLTGHSLGASQAQYVHDKLGKDPNIKAVTFASHTPTGDVPAQAIANLLGDKTRVRGITNYVIPKDVIAAGTWLSGNSVTVQQTAKSPHALENYLA